jgi:capsular polysaccharide biosynthesis protein
MSAGFPTISSGSGLLSQVVVPASLPLLATPEKPRVFLTTVKISDDHIWANGLFQNIYILYKMMESLGYEPILMVDNLENNKDATIVKRFRITDFKQYIAAPFRVAAYLEMGMSCDPSIRRFFRNMGAKVAKLYMGNILNIDIETITFYPGVNFSHHVAGEIDEIWVSPHYDIHAEYAGAINGLYGKTRIAPYVWDPMFIEEHGTRYDATGFGPDSPRVFIVMEPNISFQKNALIPIMALEAYYRKYPTKVDHVIVVNGNKFKDNAYFTNSVAPNLTILKDGKLQLMPRAHVGNLMKVMKHAIIVQHQVNNEYNYSLLEFMKMGFPLIHNVPRLSSYGYYYEGNDFDGAAARIEQIAANHNPAMYQAHAEQLAWQFSIHNPANREGWRQLVTSIAPVSVNERTLYLRYLSPQNYYHYLIYMLSNLRHVSDYTTYTSVALQCPFDVLSNHRYVQELLQLLIPGLRSISMVSTPPIGSFVVPYIPDPDPLKRESEYAREAYTFLRERFLPFVSKQPSSLKRIYISRKGANKRRVLNEDEVEATLKAYGFTTVLFETMGAIEQMAVTRNAEYVLSAHGAALVNTVFCEPTTRVIELCTAKQTAFQHVSHIAECLGVRHQRLICEAASDSLESDMRVNCKELQTLCSSF